MYIQSCVELSIEFYGTRNWGFQSIRELCTEPRKLGSWETIPLPTMPCGGLWLVDSICDSDRGQGKVTCSLSFMICGQHHSASRRSDGMDMRVMEFGENVDEMQSVAGVGVSR